MQRLMWKSHEAMLLLPSLLLLFVRPCTPCCAATNVSAIQVKQEDVSEQLLAVTINDQAPDETVLLLRRVDGRFFATDVDLRRWRLALPTTPDMLYQGKNYYAIDAFSGLSYTLDERNMTLSISSPPELFDTTSITARPTTSVTPVTPAPGGFVNYDFFGQYTAGQPSFAGLVEVGFFNRFGAGVSSFLGHASHDAPQFLRLNTTWTIDMPAQGARLQLGDTVSRSGVWSRAVRFGGAQWGSNFSLHPEFIPFATPTIHGEAVVPSTVDLYVNHAFVLRREIPPGGFDIGNLPTIVGQGEIQVLVSDQLGRQQTVVLPYYSSQKILRPHLHDYSYEIGFVREDFALESNRYGRPFAAATHRFGFNEYFTAEVHAEVLEKQQALGISGTLLWPSMGVLDASLAVSRSDAGSGVLVGFGAEHLGRWYSFRLATELADGDFTQLGQLSKQPLPYWRSLAFVSVNTRLLGSLGLGYVYQESRHQRDVELLTFNLSRHLGKTLGLHLSASQDLRNHAYTVFMTFSRPLGQHSSLSSSVAMQGNTTQVSAQLVHNPPPGDGVGYRLRMVEGDTMRVEAGGTLRHRAGTYQLEVAQQEDENSLRFGVSGGVATLGGHTFFSQRISDSFAVVAVPYDNVGVYADNQLVAHTDRQGYALLPHLRPYEKNPIRLDATDLPLDAQVDTLEMTAIPFYRSGVFLKFPVRQAHGALLRIVLQDGRPLSAGAVVSIVGQDSDFPVGLNGEAYITGLAPQNRLRATWRGQSCEFDVAFPTTADPLPYLGDFLCLDMAL